MSILQEAMDFDAASTPLAAMVQSGSLIGGIYTMDYSHAVVLTNDYDKTQAGGVPLGGFLLAAAGVRRGEHFVLDDEEVILLQVRGTHALPNERDLVETRLAVVRDATATEQDFDSVSDELTRVRLQESAFDCAVVGTFYAPKHGGLEFGSDIDNVVSSARYQVFLPSPDVLSGIASFQEVDPEEEPEEPLTIGRVRFSSTRRKSQLAGTDQAEVKIRVADFVERKTAVFGMTRTGKSNTIKTLVTAIYNRGVVQGKPIGQLIFDPQGEYANLNKQDKTGLRRLADTPDKVKVYKNNPKPVEPVEQALRINFLDPAAAATVWDMVQTAVAEGVSSSAQYMAGFRSISMEDPDPSDFRAVSHHERNMVAFYALMDRAGVGGKLTTPIRLTINNAAVNAVLADGPTDVTGNGKHVWVSSTDGADALLKWLKERNEAGNLDTQGKNSWKMDFESGQLHDILKAMEGRAGDAAIKRLKPFHDVQATGDIGQKVWDDMCNGRLVIVDLSQGSESVIKTISERIVTVLLNQARDLFSAGEEPIPFQIVVEEAHNLFERGKRDTEGDPWVRLAKEAGKYKIGMMYATQEVTGVDERVLSNTSNWVVAHLNSDRQTRELGGYYKFADWAQSLLACEDRGFVRMKTFSSKYIVPVQVDKFDRAMINDARAAAGLGPVDEDGQVI